MNKGNYGVRNHGSARSYAEFTFTAPGAGTSVTVSTGVDGCNIVASIAHVAGTNTLTVTLTDQFNKVMHASASILEATGKRATCGAPSNEGSATLPVSFIVYTWVAAGTVDNDNADRITVQLALRNGSQGVK